MSKISFLIATKNRADVIGQTIDSLLGQTESDWEAIIVDDHGVDNTGMVVSNYQDERLRYFYLTGKVSGAANARNFAALQAKSNIVAILDADDLSYSDRAELTIKAFTDSDIDVFYANLDIWDMTKNEVRDRKTPVVKFDFELFKEKDFIPHSTVAMRKQLLLDNPYNSGFKLAEDYDLLSRLAIQNKIFYYEDRKLLKYRLWPGNTVNNEKKQELEDYTYLVQMLRGWVVWDDNVLNRIYENKKVD